jgi:hypothetical protein
LIDWLIDWFLLKSHLKGGFRRGWSVIFITFLLSSKMLQKFAQLLGALAARIFCRNILQYLTECYSSSGSKYFFSFWDYFIQKSIHLLKVYIFMVLWAHDGPLKAHFSIKITLLILAINFIVTGNKTDRERGTMAIDIQR